MYKEIRAKGTNQIFFKLQQSIFDWLVSEEFNLYKEKIENMMMYQKCNI
jgi:hypothetical protein